MSIFNCKKIFRGYTRLKATPIKWRGGRDGGKRRTGEARGGERKEERGKGEGLRHGCWGMDAPERSCYSRLTRNTMQGL